MKEKVTVDGVVDQERYQEKVGADTHRVRKESPTLRDA
jgi:hypothetical protein